MTPIRAAEGGRRTMTSQPSEERNRLRLQAWEQRNQESGQAKEQNCENVPLFGQPYKTNKGDELSSRIQKMLGSYENNATSEPCGVSSSLTSPLSNCIHSITELPFEQVHYNSTQSQKGPSADPSTARPFNSPNHHHEDVSKVSSQGSQLIHSSPLQQISALKDNVIHHEKPYSADVRLLPFLHSTDHDNAEPKDRQFNTFDRPLHQVSTENTTNHVNSVDLSCKDASPPLNRTISTLHSQAFHPPLSYKQPNAAVPQKPTAYVRPMDGLDQVVSESPELKPSPEHYTSLPECILDKSIQGKDRLFPQFLETKTSEVHCVEDILREMTCSWPPLLTGIHSPRSDHPSKSQCSVKITDEEHPRQINDQAPSTDPSHYQQSSSVLPAETHSSAVESVCSSDSETGSKSESDGESATDHPPASSSVEREPAATAQLAPGDWQLDKLIPFTQQNYRSKSQWASHTSKSLKPQQLTDGFKHPSINARDAPNLLSLNQKTFTDNFTAPQQPCSSSQDNNYQQSSHKSLLTKNPSESTRPSDSVKQTEESQKGGVSVHFDRALSVQEEEPKDRPKVKTEERCHKQSKNRSVVVECEISANKKKVWSEVGPEVSLIQYDQCASCIKSSNQHHAQSPSQSDQVSPVASFTCSCGKSKVEATLKNNKLSQKNKCLKKGDSQDCSKNTLSLVVKINLSLLSRIPQNSATLETKILQHCTKDEKMHKVTKNGRKNDKEDQNFPMKKQRLEGKNPTLHTARPENSNPSDAPERKKAKKSHKLTHPSSSPKDTAQKCRKHKRYPDNAPQSNTQDIKYPNSHTPRKSSGKSMEQSNLEKPIRESLSNRALLRFEDRHYPVKHYIKEAKRLKHKADAEMDKLRKMFNYLDAALYFIESGIAMERDPQISVSSYTMFAETVELIKFVLKLINSEDPSSTENDILALCLKCQALLQMAMFQHKQKTALKYSKTLLDHFNTSTLPAPDPSAVMKGKNTPVSPANALMSSGSAPSHSKSGSAARPFNGNLSGTVVVSQDIGQVAFNYVNITTLFLNAHDIWEQAEEFANKGSGLSAELDTAMGAVSLTSTMSSMVRYTRQGLHWLRMEKKNGQKVK